MGKAEERGRVDCVVVLQKNMKKGVGISNSDLLCNWTIATCDEVAQEQSKRSLKTRAVQLKQKARLNLAFFNI